MWTKEEKAEMRKNYKFVKAGRKGTPTSILMALVKDGYNNTVFAPVIMCEEKDGDYVFMNRCPYCGEFHIHGNKPGLRCPHCGNDRYKLLCKAYPNAIHDYFIANKQEYSAMWNWAEKMD